MQSIGAVGVAVSLCGAAIAELSPPHWLGGLEKVTSTTMIDDHNEFVVVRVACTGMPDGSLKDCRVIESVPKNGVAEKIGLQIISQQRGSPPQDWPEHGKPLEMEIRVGAPRATSGDKSLTPRL
jgi:hypothetical protein